MRVALVDANDFYISCERVFDPKLRGAPAIVLGNNDGIIVSRSPEAKALGLKMGFPAFKARDLIRQHGVRALSSNYTLYSAMSDRLMAVLTAFGPKVEKYSIDEAFIDLSGLTQDAAIDQGHKIRAMVQQWIGLPVCIGIGTTKTIAKLANHVAKIIPELNGICDLTEPNYRQKCFEVIGLDEVWGIGPAAAEKLVRLGFRSVESLRRMDPRHARNVITVGGERIIHELNGITCLPVTTSPPARKGAAVTRNFGHPIYEFEQMREAVAAYTTRLAEKLREDKQATQVLTIFMHTNRYTEDPWRGASKKVRLQEPTADTIQLVQLATEAARQIWKDGYRYSKAGVLADDLVPFGKGQRSLFEPEKLSRAPLMAALDRVNAKMGRGTLKPLGAGVRPTWTTRFGKRSPGYLTRWDELPLVQSDSSKLRTVRQSPNR